MQRMFIMTTTSTSNVRNGETRVDLLKRLLKEASPRNPTYILGRIIADFRAQSTTELTVRRGEEVFVLFEINDWAFATPLSDTNRKGYVPLDYCDIIKDFYELSPHSRKPQRKVGCPGYTTESHGDGNQVAKDCGPSHTLQHYETDSSRLGYYENKLKEKPETACSQSILSKHRADNFQSYCRLQKSSHTNTNTLCNSSASCELYGEQTTPVKTCRSHQMSSRTNCCCCCENRKCGSSRQDRYNNVLHYLRDSQVADSQCDDSESGLGDSESILSFSDPHTSKAPVDLNDMSTQTSQSLEDIQKQFEQLSADLELAVTDIPVDSLSAEDNHEGTCNQYLSNQARASPQPSIDSLLSDSMNDCATTDVSTVDSDDTDHESTSSFHCEKYDTVKRRDSKVTSESAPVMECSKDREYSHLPEKSALSTHSNVAKSSTTRKSVHFETPEWKSLSLPILEKGKFPNRVELSQLSARIKDKLKPTRDELLHQRLKEPPQSSTRDELLHQRSTEPEQLSTIPEITVSSTAKMSNHSSTTSHTASRSMGNTSTSHSGEITQREMTLQTIQEQYMKLEEARLLHNALKHLHDTMDVTERLDPSNSS